MNDQKILTQLNKLKTVEPDRDWVVAARGEVLKSAPVFDASVSAEKSQNAGFNVSAVRANKTNDAGFFNDYRRDKKSFVLSKNNKNENKERKFSFPTLFNINQFKPAMAGLMAVMIVFTGSVLTVQASRDSLPGDSLYGIKRMMEGTQITIAANDKKAILETKFVGRRLEEMVKISENISDIEQQNKIEKLAKEVEEGMKRTEDHLANTEKSKSSAKTAKEVNAQTEKYTDALTKTTEKLSEPVKKEIEEVMAIAADSTEKVNFQALGIMAAAIEAEDKTEAEEAGISEEEVKDKIQIIIDKKVDSDEGSEEIVSDGEIVVDEEIKPGDDEDIIETEIKTEKVDIDCLECEESEKDCLEEIDEEGNIKCYFEVETIEVTAEELLEDGELTAALEKLEEEGEVKGDGDEAVVEKETEEEVKELN